MPDITRGLAQLLLSKIGGNINHKDITILCELIDNSLDYKATKININIVEKNNAKYLVIYDNGNGTKKIDNFFSGEEGKINKIGCKNQAFLDIIAFLSTITGELNIVTNCDNKFARISVDFDELQNEYQRQLESKCIDYNKCQKILMNNYNTFTHKNTMEYLESHNEILEQIQNGGTFIQIPLDKTKKFELANINPSVF